MSAEVRVSQVSSTHSGTAPRIAATVDGVKVTWRVRKQGPNWPAYTGWICFEHGKDDCDHRADLEDVLADEILDRLEQWEGRERRAS